MKLPVSAKINMFCQVSGEVKIRLIPTRDCEKDCIVQRLILKQGQIRITIAFISFNDIFKLFFN
jgi:hypothetical protein